MQWWLDAWPMTKINNAEYNHTIIDDIGEMGYWSNKIYNHIEIFLTQDIMSQLI